MFDFLVQCRLTDFAQDIVVGQFDSDAFISAASTSSVAPHQRPSDIQNTQTSRTLVIPELIPKLRPIGESAKTRS
jgi:hypothetical protein